MASKRNSNSRRVSLEINPQEQKEIEKREKKDRDEISRNNLAKTQALVDKDFGLSSRWSSRSSRGRQSGKTRQTSRGSTCSDRGRSFSSSKKVSVTAKNYGTAKNRSGSTVSAERETGSRLHKLIERYLKTGANKHLEAIKDLVGDRFENFLAEFDWINESRDSWKVEYSVEDASCKGILDFAAKRPNGNFVIFDWKHWCMKSLNNPIYKESANGQLRDYKAMFEKQDNIKVERMYKVILHTDFDDFVVQEVINN